MLYDDFMLSSRRQSQTNAYRRLTAYVPDEVKQEILRLAELEGISVSAYLSRDLNARFRR